MKGTYFCHHLGRGTRRTSCLIEGWSGWEGQLGPRWASQAKKCSPSRSWPLKYFSFPSPTNRAARRSSDILAPPYCLADEREAMAAGAAQAAELWGSAGPDRNLAQAGCQSSRPRIRRINSRPTRPSTSTDRHKAIAAKYRAYCHLVKAKQLPSARDERTPPESAARHVTSRPAAAGRRTHTATSRHARVDKACTVTQSLLTRAVSAMIEEPAWPAASDSRLYAERRHSGHARSQEGGPKWRRPLPQTAPHSADGSP